MTGEDYMKENENRHARMKAWLIRKIQPSIEPYGIRQETIANAVEESLREIKRDGSDIKPWLMSLIFWKIFDEKSFLPINLQTPAGNTVSLDVLTAAHALWGKARQAAVMLGVDDVDVTEALVYVVYVIADRLARGKGASIRNIHKYLFKGWLNKLKRVAGKIGIARCNDLKDDSDGGAFITAVENLILCDEILASCLRKKKTLLFFTISWAIAAEKQRRRWAYRRVPCGRLSAGISENMPDTPTKTT